MTTTSRRWLLAPLLMCAACGASAGTSSGADPVQQASPSSVFVSPSATSAPSETPRPDEERTGAVKAPPTVRLRQTDEFGLVVAAARHPQGVVVTVDRVDSLTGEHGASAAAARGMDYSNDHFEVNDNPTTRQYVLALNPVIWQANPADVSNPKQMSIEEWLTYLASARGRTAMFHLHVEGGRTVGVEEQYYP